MQTKHTQAAGQGIDDPSNYEIRRRSANTRQALEDALREAEYRDADVMPPTIRAILTACFIGVILGVFFIVTDSYWGG